MIHETLQLVFECIHPYVDHPSLDDENKLNSHFPKCVIYFRFEETKIEESGDLGDGASSLNDGFSRMPSNHQALRNKLRIMMMI